MGYDHRLLVMDFFLRVAELHSHGVIVLILNDVY